MENTLFKWKKEERKAVKQIFYFQSNHMLKKFCTQNDKDKEFDAIDFKTSNGWLERFLHTHNIVKKSVTCICQKVPNNANELCETLIY